ncbi:MAG: nitroreductase family protein [Mariprofundales bacterium]
MARQRTETDIPIGPLFADRWSPYAFDPNQPLTSEQLACCIEAARWAPSCFGDEPWRFIICVKAEQPQAWQSLLVCLSPKNQEWAKNAPVLLLACADTLFSQVGKPNRWGAYDTGQATISLCLQAAALGLATHQMGGFDEAAVRTAFHIPDHFTPMSAIALGHHGDAGELEGGFRTVQENSRARKPLKSRFFHGQPGHEAWSS